MALNPARLALPIKDAFVAAGAVDGPATLALALGIATAVVQEILINATVAGLGLVSIPLGGPVTGVAKVT